MPLLHVRDEVILDIGCGTGQTLGQLALKVGPSGRVIGVDISARLLSVARSRTSEWPCIELIEHDAATLALPDASADGIFSRFGVMAFDDAVRAFSNFNRILKDGGRLSFVCWRALEENDLDNVPLRAAGLEARIDRTPFAFENADFTATVLRSAGFQHIKIEPFDAEVSSGGINEMLEVLTKVGPLGRILREAPELLAEARLRVRAALIARQHGLNVSLAAATWVVTAAK